MQNISRVRSEQVRQRRQLEARTSALVMWGWVMAVLIAPVGFVIGAILVGKGRTGHGVAQMAVAILIVASLIATA